MKRQYSFNEISRMAMAVNESQGKSASPYFMSNKTRQTWTDMRVEEIKKKYDTPSHRKNYSNFTNNDKTKQNQPETPNNPYSSYRSPLRDALPSTNIVRKDRSIGTNSGYKDPASYQPIRQENVQNIPRYTYEPKDNNFMEKFSQIKNSMKNQSKATPSKENQYKARDVPRDVPRDGTRDVARDPPCRESVGVSSKIDPRVQNIDKINMKIKKILDCLNENEKMVRAQRYENNLDPNKDMKNSFIRGSIMSKDNQTDDLEETKILSRQKIGYDQPKSNLKGSIMSSDKYGIGFSNSFQKQENLRPQSKFQSKYQYIRTTSTVNNSPYQNVTTNPSSYPTSTATPIRYSWQKYEKDQKDQKYENLKTQETVPTTHVVQNFPKRSMINHPSSTVKENTEHAGQKKQQSNRSWFETSITKNRSRSCLNGGKDGEFKSGKKIDEQITKINARIKQFEEEKKKLNIEFTPYNQLRYNRSSSNLNLPEHKTQRTATTTTLTTKPPLPKQAQKNQSISSTSSNYMQSRSTFPEKIKTQSKSNNENQPPRTNFDSNKKDPYNYRYNLTSTPTPTTPTPKPQSTNTTTLPPNQSQKSPNKSTQKQNPNPSASKTRPPLSLNHIFSNNAQITTSISASPMFKNNQDTDGNYQERKFSIDKLSARIFQDNSTPEFQEKMQSVSEEEILRQKEIQVAKAEEQDNKYSNQLKIKTEEGIQERKRKLLETATVSFSRETKRLISNLFEQVKLDEDLRNAKIWLRDLFTPNKWELLKNEASTLGVSFNQQHFQVSEEQDNPFYSVRESQQSYSCLVNRWIKAENFWKNNIEGQYNLREFEIQKFTEDKVDLEKKGYFVLEDLVRFLNMQTGTFYRNRDLILVFRRLTHTQKLSWSQFQDKLGQTFQK